MRWLLAAVVVVGVVVGGPHLGTTSHSAPTVDIRARTQLALGRIKVTSQGRVEVLGHLSDKLTGEGIPNERVTLVVGGTLQTVVTGPDGSFRVEVEAPAGPVQVQLDYKGGGRLEGADPLTMTADPSKADVELAIVKTTDDVAGAKIRIDAKIDGNADVVPVELAIAPVTGGDTFKVLRTVDTGTELLLARKDAGGAGTYRLRAVFAGDDRRQRADAIVTIEMASGSRTSMSLSSTQLAYEDDLTVTGAVTDDDGTSLRGAAVTLMSGDRRLAQSTTGADGHYRFSIEAEVIGQGQFGMQVQADPGTSFIKGSRSSPQVVRIAAPQPVPVSWTIAAFLATVLAAGGFFAARTKPWRRLRRPDKPAEVPTDEGEIDVPAAGGLVTAKPGMVATLRRPNDDGFSGVVRDTVRGRPVEGALIVLTLGDRERTTRAAVDGSFTIEKLETGDWQAEVGAAGHVRERFAVTVPHRGELRGVRIDLVPVRERVFQLYRRAAEPVLPEGRLWGIWSPRQIVDHVRAKRPSPALAELTDFVEEIYFSGRLAEETVLPQAEGRVTRAVHERAQRPR